VGRALAASLEDFDIPHQSFVDLIEGCEEDLDFRQPRNQAELDHYCDKVATSMGRICLSIFGHRHPEAEGWARSLSHALQLTNILRDLREDFERGRIYLPREWMEQEHLSADELVPQAPTAAWKALMSRGIASARRNYDASLALLATVEEDSRLAVALMRGVYLEILEEIEREPSRVLRERVSLGPSAVETVRVRARALVSQGEAVLAGALDSDADLRPTETPTVT
jgi:phytoene synthase